MNYEVGEKRKGRGSLSICTNINFQYSGKRLSEIQTKLCLAWFIACDTVPNTTAHRYSRD